MGGKVVNEIAPKKGTLHHPTSCLPLVSFGLKFWSGERFRKIWRSVCKSWSQRKLLLEGDSEGSVPFLQAETVTGFASAYLLKDVCTENSLGRQRRVSLQSSGLVCLLSRAIKIKASPRQRWQVCVQPTIRAWGFLSLAPLLWHALLRLKVSSGLVWPLCGTGTCGTGTGQWWYSGYCYC